MGLYSDHVLPRIMDAVLRGAELAEIRARVAAGLAGEVLEIGFGSGLNVPHYPRAVSRVWAVDPATVGRKLAAARVAASPTPVVYLDVDGPWLRLDDDSVDHVLVTWTLCTIAEVERSVAEIHRVLRPNGTLRFVEHGLSPHPAVARWQNRLTPLQRRVGGGCHLNRPISALLTQSGLTLDSLDHYYAKGPKAFSYMYEGVARK